MAGVCGKHIKILSKINKKSYIPIYYDELVDDPKTIKKIFEFLNIDLNNEDLIMMSASVNRKARNSGWKYSHNTSISEVNRINKLIHDFIKTK